MKYQAVKINFEPRERETECNFERMRNETKKGRGGTDDSRTIVAETPRIVREKKIYIERDKKESLNGL